MTKKVQKPSKIKKLTKKQIEEVKGGLLRAYDSIGISDTKE